MRTTGGEGICVAEGVRKQRRTRETTCGRLSGMRGESGDVFGASGRAETRENIRKKKALSGSVLGELEVAAEAGRCMHGAVVRNGRVEFLPAAVLTLRKKDDGEEFVEIRGELSASAWSLMDRLSEEEQLEMWRRLRSRGEAVLTRRGLLPAPADFFRA